MCFRTQSQWNILKFMPYHYCSVSTTTQHIRRDSTLSQRPRQDASALLRALQIPEFSYYFLEILQKIWHPPEACWREGTAAWSSCCCRTWAAGGWAHGPQPLSHWQLALQSPAQAYQRSCLLSWWQGAGKHSAVPSADALDPLSKPRILTGLAALIGMGCLRFQAEPFWSQCSPSTSRSSANLLSSCLLCQSLKKQTLQHRRDVAQY